MGSSEQRYAKSRRNFDIDMNMLDFPGFRSSRFGV
jgi:hypothetical protein